jgi:hypothetical protein
MAIKNPIQSNLIGMSMLKYMGIVTPQAQPAEAK